MALGTLKAKETVGVLMAKGMVGVPILQIKVVGDKTTTGGTRITILTTGGLITMVGAVRDK